ncbi:MAG TPA: Lrp/AsnC family transcriptional regulator [archaeon]|nr:Lrp/AsnC family transcriptional regulator [archaeon]
MSIEIDKIDREILRELLSGARKSYREIARKVGVTTTTVIKRVAKLKKEKAIKGDTVILDPEKLGFSFTVMIEIIFSKGRLLETEETIAKHYNVFAVYDLTGERDAVILARFRDRAELNAFVKNLLKNPSVERTNTHIVLNTIKEDWRVPV